MRKSLNLSYLMAFLFFLLAVWSETSVIAGGFMIPHQTARGLSLSNALTAGVNDPSAVYYNPAALGEVVGNNFLVNGMYINTINSVENSGRTSRNKHDDNFIATAFANYHIPSTDLTLGIGMYTPFGLATTYDAEFTRFAAERSELRTLYITPAFSWHPSKYVSIGAGFSFVHASAALSRGLCFDAFTGCINPGGALEGRLRLTDTANAFTYNLGLLVKPMERLKIGFSYRARADIRFDSATVKLAGPFNVNQVKADVRPLPLPPVIDIGIFWQISPSWGAEFVYEYARWSEFKSLAATFSPTPNLLGLIPVSGFKFPQDWKNTSTLRLGSFYAINKNWEIRGGLGLEESPIPNKTLSPAIPGADILTLNAGVGYKWNRLSVDLGYQATFYKTRRVTNNELEGGSATGIPYTGAPGKDKYEAFNNLVALSINYQF